MPRIIPYGVYVTYKDREGRLQEQEFPLRASDYATAQKVAFSYVLQVLKLKEFELRVTGA
jgi:hypothetical protein